MLDCSFCPEFQYGRTRCRTGLDIDVRSDARVVASSGGSPIPMHDPRFQDEPGPPGGAPASNLNLCVIPEKWMWILLPVLSNFVTLLVSGASRLQARMNSDPQEATS